MNNSLTILIIVFLIASCTKKKEVAKEKVSSCPDSSGVISYSTKVASIIKTSCRTTNSSCHGASSNYGDFTTYKGFISHPANHLIHSIKQDDTQNILPMPFGGSQLSDCNIAIIVNWVKRGEQNN